MWESIFATRPGNLHVGPTGELSLANRPLLDSSNHCLDTLAHDRGPLLGGGSVLGRAMVLNVKLSV